MQASSTPPVLANLVFGRPTVHRAMSKIRNLFSARHAKPPPVRLLYPPNKDQGEEQVEIPFLIGVMADLAGNAGSEPAPLLERALIELQAGDFDDCIREVRPRVRFTVENVLAEGGEIEVDLDFRSMDDFLPAAIADKTPGLRDWRVQQVPVESLNRQLSLILHHPSLMKLEGAWRGLHYLASHALESDMVRIRVLPMSKDELVRESQHCAGDSWNQSALSRHFYQDPMNRQGEPLYGCLIGDFEFSHSDTDIEALNFMMRIATRASAPFWAAASPGLFHFDSWNEICNPYDVDTRSPEYAGWWRLRDEPDARFVGLALPRFLARAPYGAGEHRQARPDIEFEEAVTAADPSHRVWANPAYLCGVIAARAFTKHRWFARTAGIESGGAIEDLPGFSGVNAHGSPVPLSSVELAVGERREMELSKFGLMPFLARANSDFIALLAFHSIQRPVEYDDDRATATAHMAARFKYHMNICRVVLYLKSIARDLRNSFGSAAELQRYLNDWLEQYVDTRPEVSTEHDMAKRPLAAAEVVLLSRDDRGSIAMRLHCMPNYQLEGLTMPIPIQFHVPDYWRRQAP